LLLAVAAKYNEMHPNLTGWQRFKPNIHFNIGRIASYTVLGGVIGAFGSVLTLSPQFNGLLTIIASAVMILLGFQLLKIFPWLNRFQPKMPKFIGHKIHDSADKEHWTAPFLLGAGTFFLPCGFTVALQLYVLSKGSVMTGALTMLVFSLGTLPSLISLGALTSYIRGEFQKDFMKFVGVVIILLGIFNMANGLSLSGVNLDLFPSTQAVSSQMESDIDTSGINPFIAQYLKNTRAPPQKVEIVNGKQIAKMKIVDLNYLPSKFIVAQGIPVEWQIDASEAAGCAQVIAVPKLGIFKYLSPNKINTIEFTPKNTEKIYFLCTMGMTSPGASFNVV
jgi:sulfite exporter TauE/SafE